MALSFYENYGLMIMGNIVNAHGSEILIIRGIYDWFGEHKAEGSSGNVANMLFIERLI